MEITQRVHKVLSDALRVMHERIGSQIWAHVQNELTSDFFSTYHRDGFFGDLDALEKALQVYNTQSHLVHSFSFPDRLLPVLKSVLVRARREKATSLAARKAKTNNPEVIAALDTELEPLDRILREEWLAPVAAAPFPHLRDVLNLEQVESITKDQISWQNRVYDEKFRILLSPSLFRPDLSFLRVKCEMRGSPLSVVFTDIDKFKDFNTDNGETHVDRHVLPRFMAVMESHIYGHGHAYRFGGDEYAFILPNSDVAFTKALLDRLRSHLNTLTFHGTDRRITLSLGVCSVGPDCFLTNDEMLQLAEKAKNFAKRGGRDAIASYGGPLYEEHELKLIG